MLYLGHFLFQCGDDFLAVLTLVHHHDALYHIICSASSHLSQRRFVAFADCGHVAHQYRYTAEVLHHDVANLLRVVQQADAAHYVGLAAALYHVAAHVDIAARQRLVELDGRDAILCQPPQVGTHLKGAHLAAEAHHVGYSGHAAQPSLDDPILEGLQLAHREAVAMQGVAIDLARGAVERLHFGAHAVGQVGIGE